MLRTLRSLFSRTREPIQIFDSFNRYAWKDPNDPNVKLDLANMKSVIEGAGYDVDRRQIYRRGDQYTVLLAHILSTRRDENRRSPSLDYQASQ